MINAITRFASRRPGVSSFISDRGTNLTGTDSVLKRELENWRNESSNQLLEKGLEWNFIPAGTPTYGRWERLVGLMKRHLASATRGDVLHVDTFNTIIIEIEGVLNRRPITPMSTNPSDTECISPAHILYPATFSHSSATIVPDKVGKGCNFRQTWKQAQPRINCFWRLWSSEYLALLHARSKWRSTRRDLKEGDLVIIVDETVKRHDWRMGRVMSTEGSGNHVRRARVKRGDGKIVLKDRTKLVHLEMDDEKE